MRLATRMRPPREKRNRNPTASARYPPRTGATTATVMKVAVTPANRPARFAGLVSRTSREFMGSQNNGREIPKAKPPPKTTQFARKDADAQLPAANVAKPQGLPGPARIRRPPAL